MNDFDFVRVRARIFGTQFAFVLGDAFASIKKKSVKSRTPAYVRAFGMLYLNISTCF
jgi:hypothetical protein